MMVPFSDFSRDTFFYQKLFEYKDSRFITYLNRHRIHSLAYQYMKHHPVQLEPQVQKQVDAACMKKKLENLKITTGLIKMVQLLDANDIRYLSLKGPLLSYELFGDVSVRDYHDIDLFIPESELFTVKELLDQNGYRNIDGLESFTPRQLEEFLKAIHHISFTSPEGVLFEIHFKIFPEAYKSENLNFDFEPLWESRRVLNYNGYRINVQGFEENIVFLIYHGSKHGYFRLKWLFDLYVLLSMPEINWESLIKRTEAINIRHMLVQTVLLVDDYFNTSLQIELKKHLTIIHSEIRLKEMAKALALDGDEDQTKLGHRHFFLFKRYKILQIKGFRYKLNYILFVFRPKKIDFQDWQLSDRFYGLYYLYRPFHRIYRLFKEK